jgi:DNA-binding NarL/FixJ family response regulator
MISKREYQVAELIAWGASDKEVADELYNLGLSVINSK